MALSEIKLAKIKVDYESGKLSKRKMALKYAISRNTIDKHAKIKGWIYAKREPELSQKIEQLTYEKLISDEVDRATNITNQFLGDIEQYRKLAMIPASELLKAYSVSKEDSTKQEPGKVTKEEFSRIWESTKVIKTAIEGLKIGYEGARKALGMDVKDDIEKARKIKAAEKQPIHDPVEGMTRNEKVKAIRELVA